MTLKKRYFLILALITLFSACTLYIPPDYHVDSRPYRVRLLVDPEDAQVLLNGRFIGEAYEFATEKSALRLRSKRNEIIVKKEGYMEEVIDLRDYDTHNITVRLRLRPADGTAPAPPRSPRPSERTKPEYVPGTVKEQEVKEIPQVEPPAEGEPVRLILEIEPAEASIYLDGKFWGISPLQGKIENLRLKPGKYLLEVVKPGFNSFKKEIHLKDQKELKLTIKLSK